MESITLKTPGRGMMSVMGMLRQVTGDTLRVVRTAGLVRIDAVPAVHAHVQPHPLPRFRI
jgi:hypothetical protein